MRGACSAQIKKMARFWADLRRTVVTKLERDADENNKAFFCTDNIALRTLTLSSYTISQHYQCALIFIRLPLLRGVRRSETWIKLVI